MSQFFTDNPNEMISIALFISQPEERKKLRLITVHPSPGRQAGAESDEWKSGVQLSRPESRSQHGVM